MSVRQTTAMEVATRVPEGGLFSKKAYQKRFVVSRCDCFGSALVSIKRSNHPAAPPLASPFSAIMNVRSLVCRTILGLRYVSRPLVAGMGWAQSQSERQTVQGMGQTISG